MTWKEKLKEEGQREKAKLQNMSWKDRAWYIWEYYKIHIALVGILFLLLYLAWTIAYNSTFTTRLSYVVINNGDNDTAGLEALDQDFRTYMGYGKKDKAGINSSLRINTADITSELEYASMAKISALVASKDLDMIIADATTIRYYMGLDAFVDLEQSLPADLWQQVKEHVLYAEDDQGRTVACGMDLSQTLFCEKAGVTISPCYVGIINGSQRTETAASWVRFVLELH